MLSKHYILILLLSVSFIAQGQTDQHWQAIYQTPKSEMNPKFFFRDGGILVDTYFSDKIAISNDKGTSWQFGESSPGFSDTNYTSERDGLNGNYYYLIDSEETLMEINRQSLETRKIYSSASDIRNFTIGDEFAYLYMTGSLKQVNLMEGAIERSIDFDEDIRQMYVSQDRGLVVYTNAKKILQLNDSLQIIKEVNVEVESLDDLSLSSDNHIVIKSDHTFSYSIDLGNSWIDVDFLDLNFTRTELGVKDYFIIQDSTVYIYDLMASEWADTIFLDTYLNIYDASDALYVFPSLNTYQGLHSIQAVEGLVKINDLIDDPNVARVYGLNDSTHFINRFDLLFSTPSLFFQNESYASTINFNNIIALNSGELVGSTSDSLYISDDGTNQFRTLSPPISPRDYIKKDHLDVLYLFRYNGIWQSFDKGETWNHECPDGFFPDFDVNERSIIPTASGKYYGIQGSKILKYDYGTKNTSTVHSSNSNTSSINQFALNNSGALFISTYNKITLKNQIQKRKNGSVEQLVLPVDDISGGLTIDRFGVIYIHSSNRVYKGLAEGSIWQDVTGDLPEDIQINSLSVGNDGTIYLACQNGPIYKTGKSTSAVNDIEKEQRAIIISPNPAIETITIGADQPIDSFGYIVNMRGQVVWKGVLNGVQPNIDVSNLKTGIYVLNFSDDRYQGVSFIKE